MATSTISTVLRTLMFKKNIRTAQLAREVNLPQQTVQRIVSGVSPNPHKTTLKPIAEFFGVSIDQLKGEGGLDDALLNPLVAATQTPQARQIPLIAWNQLHEADLAADGDHVEKHIIVDSTTAEGAFAIRMKDSSMEPYFPRDSVLIIDPKKAAEDRSFVLVKLANCTEVIFRQLLMDGQNRYLKPLNPDFTMFHMRPLGDDDIIMGALTEFRHRY